MRKEQGSKPSACAERVLGGIVSAVANAGLRVAGIVSLASVLAIGVYVSGSLRRTSSARTRALRDQVDDPEIPIDRAIPDPAEFMTAAGKDVHDLGLVMDPAKLLAVQRHASLVDKPLVLAAGRSWFAAPLRVRIDQEKVKYQKHGAIVTASHTIATITNTGSIPVAYFAVLRSEDRGRCEVRGARMHNAMALLPDESAEIVVCAGTGKVRIETLEILEVSELGYYYFSKVPPLAASHDGVTAAAHRPPKSVQLCQHMDYATLAGRLTEGSMRWVDLADFFSRHDCERFRFLPGYRYQERPLARLPANVAE